MREVHFVRSGSANVFFCYEEDQIIAVKKVFFRKPIEKLERETNALIALESSSGKDHFPRVTKVCADISAFYMEYCGERLTKSNLPSNWRIQVDNILLSLDEKDIVNGDIDIKNLAVKQNNLFLLDFGNIRLKNDTFFHKHDFEIYKTKQHHKLLLICQALENNQDTLTALNKYNKEFSNYYKNNVL